MFPKHLGTPSHDLYPCSRHLQYCESQLAPKMHHVTLSFRCRSPLQCSGLLKHTTLNASWRVVSVTDPRVQFKVFQRFLPCSYFWITSMRRHFLNGHHLTIGQSLCAHLTAMGCTQGFPPRMTACDEVMTGRSNSQPFRVVSQILSWP
jgi:hypothetical protein